MSKLETGWSDEWPHKAGAGDEYYFVRRADRNDVVIMGFSMGKAWLNGVAYEPAKMRSHLFLGPITPAEAEQLVRLRELADKALMRLEENESWWQDLVPRFKDDVFWRATFEARREACKREAAALRHALGGQERGLTEMPEKLYQASFYCTLLISAASQREAVAKVKSIAQRNHLKIENGNSERLQVYRHRPNGMLKRGPRFSPVEKH